MRICAAQTRPIKGDIQGNIERHKTLIDLAVSNKADLIVFPELSLTGYEPELARELATHQDDSRFDDFQHASNTRQITIGVGTPTKSSTGICISTVLFQPHKARRTYSKRFLHPDELEFFVAGQSSPGLTVNGTNIALAICYEISIPEHAANAFESGSAFYLASVAKSVNAVGQACERLSDVGRQYSMTVLMSNSVGPTGDGECAGKSSVWNNKGQLAGQLNDTSEGILVFDTETQEQIERAV